MQYLCFINRCNADVWQVWISLITGIIFLVTLIVTYISYSASLKRNNAKVLFSFNERFLNEVSIQNIVRFLTHTSISENCKIDLEKIDKEESITLYDKEIFFRFMEELEYSIQQKYITEDTVYDFFWYYCNKALNKWYPDDQVNWRLLLKFKDRMEEYDSKKKD